MRSRLDVVAIEQQSKFSEVMKIIRETGYSRIPVYEGTRDNIKGILYVRDLLPYITENNDFHWQELIREACIVTEDKKIDDLLKIFQKIKNHMAIIVDVNVGMVGIVTLEDILEEIVGEIDDESDDVEQDYTKIDDHTYIFEGKVLLHDFFRIMDLNKSDFEQVMGEAETLAGMILEIKGELPQMGDCIDFMDLSFCTESVEKRRIKQIKVTINDKNVSKI
jgi:CBS domain containing-hemolysin-like protein